MKISVITPSYNQGKYILGCIQSIRNQCHQLIEHIILDNHSSDETGGYLAEYQSNPGNIDVKILIEPDNGQTDAIIKGFQMATGDIICWLNTDERYTPGALAHVAEYFKINTSVDFLFGNCTFIGSDGSLIKEKKEYGYDFNMLLYYGCYIPSCSTFVRRHVIDNGCLLDASFKICMDFDWYVRIAAAGYKFAHTPINLAQFTWHDTNISRIFVDRRIEERHKVQLKFGGGIGPAHFKIGFFNLLKVLYISKRILIRAKHRLIG